MIQRIADTAHPGLSEQAEIFAEKLKLCPKACFAFVQGHAVRGYCFAHPWTLYRIPKLNQLLHHLPSAPDCVLIHDVVVLEQARGQGAARALIDLVSNFAVSQGMQYLALISVYDTHLLWGHFGFEVIEMDRLSHHLTSYGSTARYMVRKLS